MMMVDVPIDDDRYDRRHTEESEKKNNNGRSNGLF
jgi:hypothetical protein